MIEERNNGNKLVGFYLGKVIQHLSHGCIKVFIPSIYPKEFQDQPEKLPMCMQVVPQFVGNNNGNGVFSYPNIGSTVVCFFANGDQNMPMTFGSIQGGNDAIHQYNIINQIDDKDIIDSKLSADKYVHDTTYEEVYDISAVSKLHRLTSGKTSLTFFEYNDDEQGGVISACIADPIQTHVRKIKPLDNKQDLVIYGADVTQSGTISAQTIDYYGKVKSEWLMNGEGTLSAQAQDWSNGITSDYIMNIDGKVHVDTQSKSVTCFVDMNTNGTIEVHAKSATGSHSIINMTKDGVMTIDTTDQLAVNTTNKVAVATTDVTIDGKSSISLKAPTISIEGTTVTMNGSTVNINGGVGDAVIAGISLKNHTHSYVDRGGWVGSGITMPPNP